MSKEVIQAWALMNNQIESIQEMVPQKQNQNKFKIKTKPFSALPTNNPSKPRAQTAAKRQAVQSAKQIEIEGFRTKPMGLDFDVICPTITRTKLKSAFEKSKIKAIQNVFFMKNKFNIEIIEFFIELYRLRIEFAQIP